MANLKITSKTNTGTDAKAIDLNEALFGIKPNQAVLHQVVVAQMAAARQGTHSTKSRSEVRGGGAKPWRQKGTGRARHGSIRSPIWRGGGVAHGPQPRDYSQKTPKKMIRLALYSALSDRQQEDSLTVISDFKIDKPNTKKAAEILTALDFRPAKDRWPSILLVLTREEETEFLSFRNITQVQCLVVDELNSYDILANDHIVFSNAALEVTQTRFLPKTKKSVEAKKASKAETKVEAKTEKKAPVKKAAAKKAPAKKAEVETSETTEKAGDE
jgi:large subunit ribosomal protein L4